MSSHFWLFRSQALTQHLSYVWSLREFSTCIIWCGWKRAEDNVFWYHEAVTIHISWDAELFHSYLYLQNGILMKEIHLQPNIQDEVKLKQWYFHTLLSQLRAALLVQDVILPTVITHCIHMVSKHIPFIFGNRRNSKLCNAYECMQPYCLLKNIKNII